MCFAVARIANQHRAVRSTTCGFSTNVTNVILMNARLALARYRARRRGRRRGAIQPNFSILFESRLLLEGISVVKPVVEN
jgi:hypothetical protein